MHQYFPLRLSKTFLVSRLYGESAVSDEMLLGSFKQYVSEDERKVVEKCANGEIEANDVELSELLSNFECKRTVTKSTILKTVIEVAHKELIQRPQYVADCWKEIITSLTGSFPTVESLRIFYGQLTPTNSRVLDTIDCEPNTQEERDSLLKQFIKGLDSRMLTTFLRFFSGSDLMLFDSWQVTFTNIGDALEGP